MAQPAEDLNKIDENEDPEPVYLPDSDEENLDDLENDHTIDRDRLFARAQAALSEQLQRENEKFVLKLREKLEEVNRGKKQREDIGVDLYSQQQQLAKLQMNLEKAHDRYSIFARLRAQAEEELQQVQSMWNDKKQERETMEKKVLKAQKDLDVLNVTLKQVAEYNERMQSEIQVTKRIAYAAEDDIKKTESKKNEQDLLIDNLNEQLRQLTEQSQLYDAQLEAQRNETSTAAEMLADANKEIDAIAAEKKEYLARWKKSLIGMARRDDALQASEQALQEQQQRVQNISAEIAGYKHSIRNEQENNERLTGLLTKVQTEVAFLTQQIQQVNDKKKRHHTEFTMLRASLEKTDQELKISQLQEKQFRHEITVLEKQIQKVTQQRKAIEDEMLESLSNQMTLEKGAQNVLKEGQKLRTKIEEKEQKLADLQNEVARIKVDALNTIAYNQELKSTLDECMKELKEKEELIEKYEVEIRQRHDEIEKKQIYVGRLNRKYDSLVSNMEDENTGPLEATIKNLTKEIASKVQECDEMQRNWIKGQTELVDLMNQTNQQQEKVSELSATKTILGQKRMRVETQYQNQLSEVKELTSAVRGMRYDMARLNELIAKNVALQEELNNTTFHLENDFVLRLKELEGESLRIQGLIEQTKAEKAQLMEDIIEAERQVMFWEKKILLEKETQEALDPEYGQAEVQGMKKEIHRMQLRLSQLKRRQEALMQEMERSIGKREVIETRSNTTKSKTVTQATLRQRLMTLKSELQQVTKEGRQVESEIVRQEEENQALAEQLDKFQSEYNMIEDSKFEVAAKLDDKYLQKQMNLERLQMLQKRIRRYEAAIGGQYHPSGGRDEVVANFNSQLSKIEKLKAVLARLRDDNPKYEHFFDQLLAFCSE
eukprot:TRINITY_DN6659_c0_g3_i1.p1 TRINITY_DN6659_c0_g3~~TRINITY_DN6659_c0_g3_i1.p1  ORF type:complete len:906 (-),score=334.81 TRINITY_DN6659_c0_g3_i1:228-2891(-)